MNIIQAIKSGKPFKRPIHDGRYFPVGYGGQFFTQSILSIDWQILICEECNYSSDLSGSVVHRCRCGKEFHVDYLGLVVEKSTVTKFNSASEVQKHINKLESVRVSDAVVTKPPELKTKGHDLREYDYSSMYKCKTCDLDITHEDHVRGVYPACPGATTTGNPTPECKHEMVEYQGLFENYNYCNKCGEKE